MKLVIAATGASGAIYLQRLLAHMRPDEHEIHLVLSNHARQVIAEELGELSVPDGIFQHADQGMNVPFVSGSARFDAMAIVPCSMEGVLAPMNHDEAQEARKLLCALGDFIRDAIVHARTVQGVATLTGISRETAADTIYQIDKISEDAIAVWFEKNWPAEWPVEL